MQASADINMVEAVVGNPSGGERDTRHRAGFDVLDVPAVAGASVLAKMAADEVETGPVAMHGAERMHFYVTTKGAPADEDEWWSCGLDSSPDIVTQAWRCTGTAGTVSCSPHPPVRHGQGVR